MSLRTRTSRKSGERVDRLGHFLVDDLGKERALGIVDFDGTIDGVWLDSLEVHGNRLEFPAPVVVDERVPQDGKQPALGVGSRAILLPRPVRLEHRVLHQVLGLSRVARETERDPIERVQVRKRFLVERTNCGGGLGHGINLMADEVPHLPVTTATAVPAIIPLSLLEAIRNLDTPVEDGLEELAEEIVVRRLGLSPTVAAQIQRYRQAADRDVAIDLDEVVSVLRLVGEERTRLSCLPTPVVAPRGTRPIGSQTGADARTDVARGCRPANRPSCSGKTVPRRVRR